MHQHMYFKIWGANLPLSKKSKCIQSITLKIFNISKHNAINFFQYKNRTEALQE